MRSYHLLIRFYCLLILVACSTTPVEAVEPLRQAEIYTKTKPDSALILLNQQPIDYQKEKLQKENLQLKLAVHCICLTTLLLFTGGLYFFYRKHGHTKLQMRRTQKTLLESKEQVISLKSEIESYKVQQAENTIQMDSYEELQEKIATLTTANEEYRGKIELDILIKMLKQGDILAEHVTSKEWDEIFNLVNCLYFNSLCIAKSEHSHLTKHDVKLLSLLLLGFPTKELIIIFDSKDNHTIFKAKSRLKERLGLTKQEHLDDFLQNCREGKFK